MAKTVKAIEQDADPLIKLSDEARSHIEALGENIDRSYRDLEAMETLGMDTSRAREQLDWAKKARQVILDRL